MKANLKVSTTNLAYEGYSYSSSGDNYPKLKYCKEPSNVEKTGNTTSKGVLPVQSQIQINNTKYTIERAFNGVKTPAMLIEERVLENGRKNVPLTLSAEMLYDETSGSVLKN